MKNNKEECCGGHAHKMCMWVVGLVILALLVGEWMIYNNQVKLNKMMSEGFMQIKENSRFEKGLGKGPGMMGWQETQEGISPTDIIGK